MDTNGHQDMSVQAAGRLHGYVLPARLAPLINPAVLAERKALVEKKLRDEASQRVLRRRYAEVTTKRLLEIAHD